MWWLLPCFLFYGTIAGFTGAILDSKNNDHDDNAWGSWIWPLILVYWMLSAIWSGGYYVGSLPRRNRERVEAAARAAQRAAEAARDRSVELEQEMGRRPDGTYPDPHEEPGNVEKVASEATAGNLPYCNLPYCSICDKIHGFDWELPR